MMDGVQETARPMLVLGAVILVDFPPQAVMNANPNMARRGKKRGDCELPVERDCAVVVIYLCTRVVAAFRLKTLPGSSMLVCRGWGALRAGGLEDETLIWKFRPPARPVLMRL